MPYAGAVYVFERDATDAWSQQAYVKASNPDSGDGFGRRLALSDDGNTLAVGATGEASDATGIDGNQADDSIPGAGAVYVLVRDPADEWSQQAYIKASNPELGDFFGGSVALGRDGRTLAVGAHAESSGATGIGADQADDSAPGAGAVYLFERDSMDRWSQQAYVKASNAGTYDSFGTTVALSSDGDTLVVGATGEASRATGIGGRQDDDSTTGAGAVYVLVRGPLGEWSQRAYVKAPNPGPYDYFGTSVALSRDAGTLAVGASGEASHATGIGGDPADDSVPGSGAVYLY
jgi:hypothetical protein